MKDSPFIPEEYVEEMKQMEDTVVTKMIRSKIRKEKPTMTRNTEKNLRYTSIVVAVGIAALTTITTLNPDSLGLSQIQVNWLIVLLGLLGTLASFLPPPIRYGAAKRGK